MARNVATPRWGTAPSGSYALDARFQGIFIKFDQSYQLDAFSVAVDNSTQGNLVPQTIDFVSGSIIVGQLTFDQSLNPGATPTLSGSLAGVDGFILPSNAFYDNLSVSVSAVPEPSTYGVFAGLGGLGIALLRRRRPKAA